MINLAEHIEHLIVRNDCVIVPGFGSFIAEKMPAYIDEERGVFMPPSRRLSFNPLIDHNDGLLVTSLMRRHHWTYALACESLADCVTALKARLASVGSVTIGSLGSLRHQDDATPEFIPAPAAIAANPYAILPVLEVTPIKQLIAPVRQHAAAQFTSPSDTPAATLASRSFWRDLAHSPYSRIAAAVVVIATCILTFFSSTPSADRSTLAALGTNFSSASPTPMSRELYISYPDPESATATVKPAVPETRENVPVIIPATEPKQAADPVKKQQLPQSSAAPAATTAAARPAVPVQAATAHDGGGYILVVASLTSDNDARAFIRQSGDSSLKVKKMGSRYRVYSDASDSKDALVAIQPSVASRYPGAWVCEVK